MSVLCYDKWKYMGGGAVHRPSPIVIDRTQKEIMLNILKLRSHRTLKNAFRRLAFKWSICAVLIHILTNLLELLFAILAGCKEVHANIYSKDAGKYSKCVFSIQFCQAVCEHLPILWNCKSDWLTRCLCLGRRPGVFHKNTLPVTSLRMKWDCSLFKLCSSSD